ncbi:DUF3908 family protein [Bacillus hominis]|uniref:DUF3908 family protein n=1 Tax=Bacillus hominis TaxID=2817478 RepID=UPI0025A0FF25|nr:DUF3908 family protein [Bacillus hominis]MDM5434394.1 DUF3908 family protein [Bacillus hominis]
MKEDTVIREFYEFEFVEEALMRRGVIGHKLLKYAKKLVPISEDIKVYSKNLYTNEAGVKKELYFFNIDKIYILKEVNAGINYRILYKKDINNIEYKISDNDEKIVILKIKFSNGEMVEMNSVSDRGGESLEIYRDIIQHILQSLI